VTDEKQAAESHRIESKLPALNHKASYRLLAEITSTSGAGIQAFCMDHASEWHDSFYGPLDPHFQVNKPTQAVPAYWINSDGKRIAWKHVF
jgi:hypothetical protein